MSTSEGTLPLEGRSVGIFAVAIACAVLSLPTVGLRTVMKLQERKFGWDDGLMAFAAVLFGVECGLAAWAARVGLGRRNKDLDEYFSVQSIKYLLIWMLHYISCLLVVKISIGVTMHRICGTNRWHHYAVYTLLFIVVANFLTTFIGVLNLCHPVEANWDTKLVLEGKATCAPMSAMIGLSYTSTAVSIFTDLAYAVLPGFILWNSQMPVRTKISVYILLGIGSFASISTIIRTPAISWYKRPTEDLAYHVGDIPLWSCIETAIGLIAGSVPSLRRLVKRRQEQNSSSGTYGAKNSGAGPSGQRGGNSLLTFGSMPVRPLAANHKGGSSFRNPTDMGRTTATIQADGDWERLPGEEDPHYVTDDRSDENILTGPDAKDSGGRTRRSRGRFGAIRTDKTYAVEIIPLETQEKK